MNSLDCSWEEVTLIFQDAADNLMEDSVKPMVNSCQFSLFDSMSAVEVHLFHYHSVCHYNSLLHSC